jgi:hypothetical protein
MGRRKNSSGWWRRKTINQIIMYACMALPFPSSYRTNAARRHTLPAQSYIRYLRLMTRHKKTSESSKKLCFSRFVEGLSGRTSYDVAVEKVFKFFLFFRGENISKHKLSSWRWLRVDCERGEHCSVSLILWRALFLPSGSAHEQEEK